MLLDRLKIIIEKYRLLLRVWLCTRLQEKEGKFHNDGSFYKHKIPPKTVLIVEFYDYHAENLPGYVKYFQELGYGVDMFLIPKNASYDVFCKYPKNKMPKIFIGTFWYLVKLLKLKKIKQYDAVLIATDVLFIGGYTLQYGKAIGFKPKVKCLLDMGHQISNSPNCDFTISGLQNTTMLNPHYFGEVDITPKNDITTFIVVGRIASCCRNYDLLIDSMKKLIENGFDNFRVIILGYFTQQEFKIPSELKDFIKLKVDLPFSHIFKYIEQADFYLTLMDPTSEIHRRYLTDTTTGSKQLILGFLKPCLINDEFACAYDFDTTNSIVYEDSELYNAMQKAIKMNKDEYLILQANLKLFAENTYEKSLSNLKAAIDKC